MILQITLILPILQKTICGSEKKRCKYTQKPGAMQIYFALAQLHVSGRVSLSLHSVPQSRESKFSRGGGRESALNSRQMGALSRDRMDEEYRQNSRRSDCPTSFPGKVPRIRDKWVHFPGTKNENGGKVYQKRESSSYLRLISDVAGRKSGCRQFYNKLNISTLKNASAHFESFKWPKCASVLLII